MEFDINGTPALLAGEENSTVYLFVHGQCGSKREALLFANSAQGRAQVLGIDLPAHGGRTEPELEPQQAIDEIRGAAEFARARWDRVCLRTNSIGTWLSICTGFTPDKALFVSPLADMYVFLQRIMGFAGITEQQLKQQGTAEAAGVKLNWPYYCFAKSHAVNNWSAPTGILCAKNDALVGTETIEAFAKRFSCALTVSPIGEHWFHTPQQLEVLAAWEKENL